MDGFRLKRTSPTAYCDCWEKCKCKALIAGQQGARQDLLNKLLEETDLVTLNNSRLVFNIFNPLMTTPILLAATCDFQQCDILKSVDSDEHVQPPFKLRNSKWCLVSSITFIEYSSN